MRCREWTEDWSRRDETRTTDESSSVYCLCSERLSLVSLVCVVTGVAPFMARAMCDVWRSRGLCADQRLARDAYLRSLAQRTEGHAHGQARARVPKSGIYEILREATNLYGFTFEKHFAHFGPYFCTVF